MTAPIQRPWETPVYNAQCFTASIARELCGVTGNVTRVDMDNMGSDLPVWTTLRLVPAYRTKVVIEFRDRVAGVAWSRRHAALTA